MAALPPITIPALTWLTYGSDATNLVAPVVCDFTTYSSITINPTGLFRQQGQVQATGVVIDNLLSAVPIQAMIGPLIEIIPPYTKTTLTLAGSSSQVTLASTQSKIFATFFFGNYLGTTSGTNFYQAQLAAGLAVETGMISIFAGSSASIPVGYLLCDGTAISRSSYSGLFSVIGTLYGAGDGSTTFNLPNFASRVPIGAGTGQGLSTRALGSMGGLEASGLTAQMIPQHTHAVTDPGHVHNLTTQYTTSFDGTNTGGNTAQYPTTTRAEFVVVPAQAFPNTWQGQPPAPNNSILYIEGQQSYYRSDPGYGWTLRAATAFTGITIAPYGSTTPTPVPTVPPYTAVNFVIKT